MKRSKREKLNVPGKKRDVIQEKNKVFQERRKKCSREEERCVSRKQKERESQNDREKFKDIRESRSRKWDKT